MTTVVVDEQYHSVIDEHYAIHAPNHHHYIEDPLLVHTMYVPPISMPQRVVRVISVSRR